MADRLRVLLINDVQEEKKPFDALLEIDQAAEPEEAQELFIRSLQNEQAYDLVACDVNFEKSRTVQQLVLSKGSDPAIVPLGPILALPFLSSRSTVFVPYSSYWSRMRHNPEISLLAAFALIEARNERKPQDLKSIARRLGDDITKASDNFAGSFVTALSQGLPLLREQLFAEPSRLQNVGLLAQRVDALWEQGEWPPEAFKQDINIAQLKRPRAADSLPIYTLLRDVHGVLALEVTRVRRMRAIALASLYADYFIASLYPDDIAGTVRSETMWSKGFSVISQDLEAAGGEIAINDFTLEVAETLRYSDQSNNEWQKGDTIGKIIQRRRSVRAKKFPDVEDGVFIRACVLAAWTYAWQNLRDGLIERCNLRSMVKRKLGIGPADRGDHNDGAILYRRLFMIDGSNNPRLDKGGNVSWASPFREGREMVERWQLDTDEPANLTPFDRHFCEAFASLSEDEGGLDWTIGSGGGQAPKWMTSVT